MDDISIKSEIENSWNTEADYYDSRVSHGVLTGEEKQMWIKAFESVLPKSSPPLKILDVGCGTGAMGLLLSEMGHEVTGIDLSVNMMSVGKKKAKKFNSKMIFQKGDAENPPFEDNTFDGVVNRHLLWTLPHPDTALKNWCRVIKPKGRVFVIDGVWNDQKISTRMKMKIGLSLENLIERSPHGESLYSKNLNESLPNCGGVPEDKAKEYFSNAGLSDIKVIDLSHIRRNQRKRLEWYERLYTSLSYYLICGEKRG
ncbi:ubiquinone/menaquinone biosynthesis C-methylase UbiE [Methanomicrobium sp. W14]|uniref:class I SAM-dependent methyltransferase n=1 Tax=Methanomicrobium sp. W14 TaxID=2817839 RepID=UPI001AE1D806|nr:methyltransferase domain-containing protein [Methanomicrobium sp. W14]MBP2132682.1 ubiquinone/menaquinone biosynthesis C-methylase UbiE [Methanomicrobium sp. W14]